MGKREDLAEKEMLNARFCRREPFPFQQKTQFFNDFRVYGEIFYNCHETPGKPIKRLHKYHVKMWDCRQVEMYYGETDFFEMRYMAAEKAAADFDEFYELYIHGCFTSDYLEFLIANEILDFFYKGFPEIQKS